jgi:hypothetical protein
MKKVTICLALVALVALGGQAFASHVEMCAIQDAPAATLLLPYFEQDCVNPNGITTLFSVNNASAAATVAHVTVWSNKSVPVFDFDIYLTGYDVQTVSLRDVLCFGELPVTGTGGVSNVGVFSIGSTDPLDNFAATCGATGGAGAPNSPPNYTNPAIDPVVLGHFQAFLSGQPSPLTGQCASAPTDNLVGYLTIDDVHFCNLQFPSTPGYFGPGGTGVASNHNQLWGDWFLVETEDNFAQGDTMVHIQAEDGFIGGPNDYTFYERFAGGADNREPLATNFATRHFTGPFGGPGGPPGDTQLLVWRDSTTSAAAAFSCASGPVWQPLCSRQIVIFDEEENPVTVTGPPVSGVPEFEVGEPFPEETQRVVVGGPDFGIPAGFERGWLYLNLNHCIEGSGPAGGVFNAFATDPLSAQAWVTSLYSAFGKFSVGLDAVQLDSMCDPFTGAIGPGGIGPIDE